jgi:hypothetical protein
MEARFEMGEVLLTASILEVLSQFLIRIVPRDSALTDQLLKCMPRNPSEFGCLPEWEDLLSVKREGKLGPKSRLHLRHWQPQAARNRFRDFDVQGHGVNLTFDLILHRAQLQS